MSTTVGKSVTRVDAYDKVTGRFQEIAAVMAVSDKEDASHEM